MTATIEPDKATETTSSDTSETETVLIKPRRSVRFPKEDAVISVVVCTVPHREDFTEEEYAALFFSRDDYHTSRSSAKVVSKESERYGYSRNLEGTYKEKCQEAQERLNQWAMNGQGRRGLERWCHTEHGELRQHDQFQAIMTVLRAQDDMISRKNRVDPEKLRRISHKATKISRHFARMMGKADSYAMAQELRLERDERGLQGDEVGSANIDDNRTSSLMEMTVASGDDNATVDGDGAASICTTATEEYFYPPIETPPVDRESLGVVRVDEIRDSLHVGRDENPKAGGGENSTSSSSTGKRRMFGFGRKQRQDKVERGRVSRVA